MTEVALVYPNNVVRARRYVVDGLTYRLHGEDSGLEAKSPLRDHNSTFDNEDNSILHENILPGAASASELHIDGRTCLLTTSARLNDPEILSVSLSSSCASDKTDLTSPAMLELDYHQLELQPIVHVAAFSDSSWIRLTLVDNAGCFVTFFLSDQLVPVDQPCQQLRTTDYIAELPVLQAVTGQELQSTMIAFVNETTVIMALSPFLFTVDLQNVSSYTWSETQCLEDMRSRSGLRSYFSLSVTDLVLGKINDRVMDMSPTAALCISTALNPLLDASYCVTLHSDGSLRRWIMDVSVSALPLEVHKLDHSKLPPPSSWSDSRNAVSICARTYDMTFAVAAHIKTEGYLLDSESPSSANMNMEQQSTDCHLFVYSGNTQPGSESQESCMTLTVPDQAMALVGMSFSFATARCSLSVLFETSDMDSNRADTMTVIYPPSMMSIVSPEPIVLGQGSLDKVALRERERIRSMLLGPSLLHDMEDETLEHILHEMDTWYLKFLLRPMYPRGTGTVLPPSPRCIRRAMSKLVHGSSRNNLAESSLELEIIRTLYDWRHKEIRKLVLAKSPRRTKAVFSPSKSAVFVSEEPDTITPTSVYDAFVQESKEIEDELDMDVEEDENWEKVEQERATEVRAHEMRWRRLLLQIWEEEQAFRMPLAAKWLASQPAMVVIRSGLVTIAEIDTLEKKNDSTSWELTLDRFALRLLQRIESDKEKMSTMHVIEQKLSLIIAKAQLALEPLGEMFVPDLTQLAIWAESMAENSSEDHDRLENIMEDLSPSQMTTWVQSIQKSMNGTLPGLDIIECADSPSEGGTWSQRQVANYQVRHSSTALAVRCIDSVRQLNLSRALLLLSMVEGSHARNAALRAYLHSIAVLWASSQRVAMPVTVFQPQKAIHLGGIADSASPPNKRLSFGDDAISILSPTSTSTTTIIDAIIIEASQTLDTKSRMPNSAVGVAIFLTQAYFRQAFSTPGAAVTGDPFLLVELGALPRPKDAAVATDYPRLALRLLSPYVAYSLPEDSEDVLLARKEALAECLLIESHSSQSSSGVVKAQMRDIACEMLVPASPMLSDLLSQNDVQKTFDFLKTLRDTVESSPVLNANMRKFLHELLPSGTSVEISRLCDLETIKSLFAPLASGAAYDFDAEKRSAITAFALIMLHLSRVMYRLTILERHVTGRNSADNGESPMAVINFISSAIKDMDVTFSPAVCRTMPEYAKMWARLFDISIRGGEWKTAYSACVRHPKKETRESRFQRLVHAMIDHGALGELLVLCTELGERRSSSTSHPTEAEDTIDLYEIASEILVDAGSRDIYSTRALSSDPTRISDYQGSLFALHASQKQWRRAAQSMDARFLYAQKVFAMQHRTSDNSKQNMEVRNVLIVEDLVLASVGSFNAIELVRKPAHQFIVSGENGPYNKIPINISNEDPQMSIESSKRPRSILKTNETTRPGNDEDRLSRFMTRIELGGRAIRCIALKSLFFDQSADPTITKSSFLQRVDSSKDDIDILFEHGYLHMGMLLSNAWSKNREADTGSSSPEGSGLFFGCVCHMLSTYLVPAALQRSNSLHRPTLEQLVSCLDSIDSGSLPVPHVVARRDCCINDLQKVTLETAAMSVIRKVVLTYTNAESPIALEVAAMILEHNVPAIPAWLQSFMIGSSKSSSGLFACRKTGVDNVYEGDPGALLALYTNQGFLAEACTVVCTTLDKGIEMSDTARAESLASRLPEKGEIDYVPYKAIDTLWNLIEVVVSKGVLHTLEERRILEARDCMEKSLEKHFARLRISEAGIRSARALRV